MARADRHECYSIALCRALPRRLKLLCNTKPQWSARPQAFACEPAAVESDPDPLRRTPYGFKSASIS